MDHWWDENHVALGCTSVDRESTARNRNSRLAVPADAEWGNRGEHKRVDERLHAKGLLFLQGS